MASVDPLSCSKEAANKHLHRLFGKDPRWLRPKNVQEQRERVNGLRNSQRGRRSARHPAPAHDTRDPAATPDLSDSATLARSSGSSIEMRDVLKEPLYAPGMLASEMSWEPECSASSRFPNRFSADLLRRRGTALTASTDFSTDSSRDSWHSVQRKLEDHDDWSRSDQKDIFRVLKRFTLSRDSAETSPCTPDANTPYPIGQQPVISSQASPACTLPGDFIDTNHVYQMHAQIGWMLQGNQPVPGDDDFGNTILHQLAATPGFESALIQAVQLDSGSGRFPVTRTNTAGQTLLHVLHDGWYQENLDLENLLMALMATNFDFYATDVYGRNFFHILRRKSAHLGRVQEIARHFDFHSLNHRDAFGLRPMNARASTLSRLAIPPSDKSQARIEAQTRLLKIITDAIEYPENKALEDPQGLNGLHCLARVVLGKRTVQDHSSGSPVKRRRKDDQDEFEPSAVPDHCSLEKRFDYLETLLAVKQDVNHYNTAGDTVLMAFIEHTSDDDERVDLKRILERLVVAGARLEARNRAGETALQVAARLGQKYTVSVLLGLGARVHTRNADGRGLLADIDLRMSLTEHEDRDYARFQAVRAMLTGRYAKFGPAVQAPTERDEWAVRRLSPSSAY